jgi:glycosyltransferase involved in cell wall biosynthesis
MKIVLTVHTFFPDSSGGTEILTFHTAQELKSRGYRVVVWTARPSETPGCIDSYEYEGIPVMRYHSDKAMTRRRVSSDTIPEMPHPPERKNLMEMEYRNREFETCFSKYLVEYQPDVVHAFHLGKLSATTIHAAVALKIPMFFTATDFWTVCPTMQLTQPDGSICEGPDRQGINCLRHLVALTQSSFVASGLSFIPSRILTLLLVGACKSWWPEKKYSPLILAIADRMSYVRDAMNCLERVFVPTKLMADILIRHDLNPERVFYQPYGINLQNMEDMPKRRRVAFLRIGYIGTLNEHKGVHILLEAIRQLPQSATVQVKIYGNEDAYPSYVALLKSMAGADQRVSFCGTFPNDDISKIFSELDVLVTPSLWYENTPLVIYSAQASKTPVIATNLGGMSEVIEHEKNGLLFEKGNAADLAGQIIRLLDDRTLFEKLSAGSQLPKSIPEYVDELESMYRGVILDRRGKS